MKIVDSYGNELGYQQGNDYVIKDKSGSRLGWINGVNDLINTYGTKVGEVRSDGVYDVYGSRVGEVNGDNIFSLLLASLNNSSTSTPRPHKPQWEKPDNIWGWIGVILAFIISPYIELFVSHFWSDYTAERKDWWGTLFRMILFGFVIGGIVIGASGGNATATVIILILTLLPIVVVSFSRIRDAGKPWWWTLIPGANFIICGFFPSEY